MHMHTRGVGRLKQEDIQAGKMSGWVPKAPTMLPAPPIYSNYIVGACRGMLPKEKFEIIGVTSFQRHFWYHFKLCKYLFRQ